MESHNLNYSIRGGNTVLESNHVLESPKMVAKDS